MDMRSLARALGGEVVAGAISAPGPGHSKRDRSLRIWRDAQARDGFRVHSFANDDWRQCHDHVKGLVGGTLAIQERVSKHARPAQDRQSASARALELWAEAGAIGGTPAETYLASRSVTYEGDALRWHPSCPFRCVTGAIIRLPAMLALFRDILTNEPCGIHRTALRPDGSGKSDHQGIGNPKKMLGRVKGAAIKLSPDGEVTQGLGIAEGIETALTVRCAGWHTVWASGSAGAIATFPVLAGIEALTIFADTDPAGIAAARTCQARWPECRIVVPAIEGADWNDRARAA